MEEFLYSRERNLQKEAETTTNIATSHTRTSLGVKEREVRRGEESSSVRCGEIRLQKDMGGKEGENYVVTQSFREVK